MNINSKKVVTDHALVRYLERVYEFDLDKFRDEIAHGVDPSLLKIYDDKKHMITVNNIIHIIFNGRIITVYKKEK